MTSILENRTLIVNGRRTSIRLEPQLWGGLMAIAEHQGRRVNAICSEIDRTRGAVGLTSAVRMFVLHELRRPGSVPPPGAAGPEGGLIGVPAEPFDRTRMRARHVAETGDDFEVREDYGIEILHAGIPSRLRDVVAYVSSLSPVGCAWPTLDQLDHGLRRILGESYGRYRNVVDVTPDDPAKFLFLEHSGLGQGALGESMARRPVADYPWRLALPGLISDFVRFKARPGLVVQVVIRRRDGIYRHYQRLMVPAGCPSGGPPLVVTVTQPFADSQAVLEDARVLSVGR